MELDILMGHFQYFKGRTKRQYLSFCLLAKVNILSTLNVNLIDILVEHFRHLKARTEEQTMYSYTTL